MKGRRCCDRMVVVFTTTYGIGVYTTNVVCSNPIRREILYIALCDNDFQ
jgi:hypothetical protein